MNSNLYFIIILCVLLLVLLVYSRKQKNSKFGDKLFKSLVESSDTVYIMLDSNKNILFLSSNIEKILGIKSNNKSNNQIVSDVLNIPIIKNELKNWDEKKQYVSQMVEYNNPMYNHNMWIRLKIFPYREKNKEYHIIEIVDSTKEHERQHLLISQASEIKTRESQLNQITSSSYDMELDINIDSNTCNFKYFKLDNKYFGEARRGKYTEIIKEIVDKYINENDKEFVFSKLSIDNLKQHFNKFELSSISLRYRLGSEIKNNIWLESTIFFLTNKNNNKVSILTKNVTEDANSIREQNVLLQNALNDVRIADKAKTDLIATISHDVRTPLTNIIGLTESLLEKQLGLDVADDIKNIEKSSNELLGIIDGLLDISKVEKKAIQKEEKEYSVLKLFKKIENNVKEYIVNKNLKLNINLNSNLPVILYGDYRRITAAINQIVNNSIKYTDEGEININVRGEKKNTNVNLIIEIFDTGKGMDNKKLNDIINSKELSTGIGSVKQLVNLLDGSLEIESKLNKYTKVTLTFVQKIVEDNRVREKINNNKNAEIFNLKDKKILVVDDNQLNLKVTSRLLEPYQVKTTLLLSGIECVECINSQNDFDLILLDQMMPNMDGLETLNKLKQIKGFNIPVVVLTADAIKGSKEKYLNDGFDDYISKPIDKKELSRVLKKFLLEKK